MPTTLWSQQSQAPMGNGWQGRGSITVQLATDGLQALSNSTGTVMNCCYNRTLS